MKAKLAYLLTFILSILLFSVSLEPVAAAACGTIWFVVGAVFMAVR